ncbi:MAG: hypothetical protein ACI9VR_003907 [Cognaticolwellia sp.]|jgi:hypothetical protein
MPSNADNASGMVTAINACYDWFSRPETSQFKGAAWAFLSLGTENGGLSLSLADVSEALG